MRTLLLRTIGLLAASATTITAASAHDYHRSQRAVESPHAGQAAWSRDRRWRGPRHHARRHHATPRTRARYQRYQRYQRRYAIVISPHGIFRIARGTR